MIPGDIPAAVTWRWKTQPMPKQSSLRHGSAPPSTRPAPRARSQRQRAASLRVRRVLVPTDFSAAANAALRAAVPWLDRFQAELHLVHVYAPEYPAPATMVSSLIVSESQIGQRVRSRLQEVAQDHALALRRVTPPREQRPALRTNLPARSPTRNRSDHHRNSRPDGIKASRLGKHSGTGGPSRAVSGSRRAPVGRVGPSFVADLQEDPGTDRFLSCVPHKAWPMPKRSRRNSGPGSSCSIRLTFPITAPIPNTFFTIFHRCSRRPKNRRANKCSS